MDLDFREVECGALSKEERRSFISQSLRSIEMRATRFRLRASIAMDMFRIVECEG